VTQQPLVIDADGHIVESDAEILHYLPEPFRGRDDLLGMPFFPSLDGYHRGARRVADGKAHVLPRPDAKEWIEYLDEVNIAVSVLFPTAGLGFGLVADADWAVALAHGYNAWLHDRFLRHDPRLKGMALLPMQHVPAAVKELRRAVTELGMLGGVLPAAGLPEAFGDESFWPVYEAAQELNVPLAVHSAPAQGLGLDRLRKLIEVRSLTHPIGQFVQIASMLFSGVYDAFPRLRVAYCEAGAGWVPYLMERLDNEYRNRRPQAPALKVKPSEHITSGRIFFHTELSEVGLGWAVQRTRDDIYFCASDFPHEPKDEFPEGIEELLERKDLSEEAKRKVLWDSSVRLYNLDEAELRSPSARAATVA
jgi:predicted TIM-barrel fold metal-dependent hydrolase